MGSQTPYTAAMGKPLAALAALSVSITTPANCLFPPRKPERYWAQEYVGADLLREKLKARGIETKEVANLVAIWDSPFNDHGELVSHLIASPFSSASVPLPEPLDYLDLRDEERFISESRRLSVDCIRGTPCPAYINHSMKWNTNKAVAGMASVMSKVGIAVVTTAGNLPKLSDGVKTATARDRNVVLVGSLDPEGNPSDFTGYSPDITISSPSDRTLATYDFSGQGRLFGQTSGAVPMTTSTLASFTLFSDRRLPAAESQVVLRATALPLVHLPQNNLASGGMLNAYKMGEVASKIKDRCGQSRQCAKALLQEESTYDFTSEGRRLYEEGIKFFPECAGGNRLPKTDSCDQTDGLKKLRAAALLDHGDARYWDAVACVRERYFGGIGEEFYRAQAERVAKSDEDIIDDICLGRSPSRLALYLPEWALIKLTDGECLSDTIAQAALALKNNGSLYSHPENVFNAILSRPFPSILTLMYAASAVGDHASRFADPADSLRGILILSEVNSNVLTSIAMSTLDIDDFMLLGEVFAHHSIDAEVLKNAAKNAGRVEGTNELLYTVLSHPKAQGIAVAAVLETADANADRIVDLQDFLTEALSDTTLGIYPLSRAARMTAAYIHRLPDPRAIIDDIFSNPNAQPTAIARSVAMGMDHDPSSLPPLLEKVLAHSEDDAAVVEAAAWTVAINAERLDNATLLLRELEGLREQLVR